MVFPDNFRTWISNNSDKFSIVLMRSLVSFLWLSQGISKLIYRNSDMYMDYNEFLGQLGWARDTHPFGFFSTLLDSIVIPNFIIFVWIIIIIELTIGISLGLGLFTRLGSFLAMLMTLNLYLLTLGWGEWVWTFPLIFIPHFVLFFAHSGKDVGFDRKLVNSNNRFVKLLI